jgi:hypothetical protein
MPICRNIARSNGDWGHQEKSSRLTAQLEAVLSTPYVLPLARPFDAVYGDPLKRRQADPGRASELTLAPAQKPPRCVTRAADPGF